MIVSISASRYTSPSLAAAPMTVDAFKNKLLQIEADADPKKILGGPEFTTLKRDLYQLLDEAEKSEAVIAACPEYVFAREWSVYTRQDIHSWASRLLAKLEGYSMPPSQHDATLSQYIAELSPKAAEIVSQSARRISDPPSGRTSETPAPDKKKK